MNKLMTSLLFLISLNSYAEVTKDFTAPCYPLNIILEAINEFKEVPTIIGNSQRVEGSTEVTSMMLIFLNTRTQTWTMVEKVPSGLYCLIAAGDNFNVVPRNKPL